MISRFWIGVGIAVLAGLPSCGYRAAAQSAPAAASAANGLNSIGIIGQSQPASAPAAPFLQADGVETFAHGALWTSSGKTLYVYRTSASSGATLTRTVDLPATIVDGGILSDDGATIYAACSDGFLYSVDASAAASKPVRFGKLPDGTRRFTITPAGAKGGFASIAPAFAMTSDTVIACGGSRDQQVVLQLHRPARPADWGFESLCIEPRTGDLLVSSGYPDMKVYRYSTSGDQVTTDGWPRAMFALHIEPVNGVAWALKAGQGAVSLPARLPQHGEALSFNTKWAHVPLGIAPADGGGYWIASTQGITRYDSFGEAAGERIGGLPGVSNIAVAADGTVLASTASGTRLVGLMLDDLPNASLESNGDSPWSPGRKDGDVCGGMVCFGKQFLVLDKTLKQLFVFDPVKTDGGDVAWTKIETGTDLQAPRAIAGGERTLWVLDGDQCLGGPIGPAGTLAKIDLPGIASTANLIQIAADPSETDLFTSDGTTITAFKRQSDGSYAKLWQAGGYSGITGLAVGATDVYAIQKEDSQIVKVNIATGAARRVTVSVPGDVNSIKPSALTVDGSILVIADSAGSRLLLYRDKN